MDRCVQESEDRNYDSSSVSAISGSSLFSFEEEGKETNELQDNDGKLLRNGVSGDHKSPDALLAFELNQLSFKERGEINNVIHGVQRDLIQETPALLRASFEQLLIEIDATPKQNKKAYELSQTFPETYVNTEEFRLIFLRCECFNVRMAVKRMLIYLDLIHSCFGEALLKRDISLSDLDKKTMEYVEHGSLQLLPGRDRSGRRVGGNFPIAYKHCNGTLTAKHRMQAALFIMMKTAKQNVDVQKEGLVGLFWAHELKFDDIKTRSFVHVKLISGIPIRFCSLHICVPNVTDSLANMAKAMYIYAIGPENRKRLRVHFGSAMECLYALQTFGIPSHHVPINTTTGQTKNHNHIKWLERQRIRNEAESTAKNQAFNIIECPAHNDVLCGRGWPKMSHPGNARFRALIMTRLEEYNDAQSNRVKTTITWSIVCYLKETGSRFLKKEKRGWWVELSDEAAREKVSTSFRDARKARAKSEKLAYIDSNSNAGANDQSNKQPPVVATNTKRKSDQTDHALIDRKPDEDTKKKKNAISTKDFDSYTFLDMDGRRRKGFALFQCDSDCDSDC
eukprot:jgi/Psemu1/223251/e_gw1.1312.10.1